MNSGQEAAYRLRLAEGHLGPDVPGESLRRVPPAHPRQPLPDVLPAGDAMIDLALNPGKVLAVHASAVCTDAGALLFLGPSGTGKSTMGQLLSGHAPLLAHDTVCLVPGTGGRWYAADGGRRACEGPLYKEEVAALCAVPLRAILRLFQATAPRLERVDALANCRYLTDALFEIAWQREYDVATKKTIFSDLAAVCRATPGYEFYFDLTPQTLDVLNEGMGIW